jgi:hypothetical protein
MDRWVQFPLLYPVFQHSTIPTFHGAAHGGRQQEKLNSQPCLGIPKYKFIWTAGTGDHQWVKKENF